MTNFMQGTIKKPCANWILQAVIFAGKYSGSKSPLTSDIMVGKPVIKV
jgi:hypothetical protein